VYFVSPDGTDDFMVGAANVDFSATDRMFVCAGVTKKADPTNGTVVETNTSWALGSGHFTLRAPITADAILRYYGFGSRGSAAAAANIIASTTSVSFVAPVSNVVSALSDISDDFNDIRLNGVSAGSAVGDQGTGNYNNTPVYLASSGGTTNFSSANLYQLIAVGKTPTTSELNATETFVAAKTKGSLA
jgi:hypothetical protein